MDDEFKDLQRLLRLKRYEAPPPEYFEDFLFDFHRRQREELLRRPLWRLVVDRIEGAMPSLSFQRYAYAGGCAAAVAVAALTSTQILSSTPTASNTLVATTAAPAARVPSVTTPVAAAKYHSPAGARINIYAARPSLPIAPEVDFDRPRPAAVPQQAGIRPRYVLDAQPVSYEQSYSF